MWNASDVIQPLLFLITVIGQQFSMRFDILIILKTLLILFSILNLLSVLRGFKPTGYLIRTLIQNTKDMVWFLLVMMILIVCFAVMFQINVEKPSDFEVCSNIDLGDDENEERCPYRSFEASLVATLNLSLMGENTLGNMQQA